MANTESKEPPVGPNKAPKPIGVPIGASVPVGEPPGTPPGVLPRHTQAWVIGGLAVVMAIVISFSGNNAPKPKPPASTPLTVTDPNKARIEDYRRRIELETKKLNEEKEQIARERAAQTLAVLPEAAGPSYGGRPYEYSRSSAYTPPPAYASVRERSWIEEDLEKRNYLSLYAPNIALSYRQRSPGDRSRDPELTDIRQAPAKPRRAKSAQDPDGQPTDEIPDKNSADEKEKDDINQSVGPKYRLFEGTVIETALTNRLDGAFSGPVNCMTTSDIYSHNEQHVLIPAGSRVLGEVKRVDAFGQERLAVVFHRLIMPDGFTASLDKFRGLNQIGETGLRDQINHHYLQVFGVSIAIGAISGLTQANTRSGTDVSAADAYRQGVAASLSQSSLRILDRYLNVLPTITIREGQRVKIYLADDLLLPAYENHRMPNDL